MIHFLIVQLGSDDLMVTALASIDRFAGECNVDVVKLPIATTDPRAHGQAIDDWRKFQKFGIADTDIVVLMDPDVVLLSAQWRKELDAAFTDPHLGVWGAGAKEDFGPRVHASMFAVRGSIFNTLERSFTPCLDLRERTWRDTAGLYCMWVHDVGYEVCPVERGIDWHGVSAWWGLQAFDMQIQISRGTATEYAHMGGKSKMLTPTPLWAHLGGGSHSDPARMTTWQRVRNWRSVQRRKQFINATRALLTHA